MSAQHGLGEYRFLFDEALYRFSGPEFRGDAFEHFRTVGWREHRKPHRLFDVAFYLEQIPEVESGDIDPLTHFVERGAVAGIDPHPLFDVRYYYDRYRDVPSAPFLAVAGRNPLAHYLDVGGVHGFDPHPYFATEAYRAANAECRERGFNPLEHYVEFGAARPDLLPSERFDARAYAQRRGLDGDVNPLIDFALRLRAARARRDDSPPVAGRPEVSVIVLNYGKSLMTITCLLELLDAYGADPAIEIVVVDNGSPPDDFATLAALLTPGVRVVRLSTNRFFGEGNNIGVESTSGRYVLFLNNDAYVDERTIPVLLAAFEEHADAGAAGPLFVYPDGQVQEAGASMSSCGTAVQRAKYLDSVPPWIGRAEPVDYVSAACVMVPRALFDQAGGFDPAWEPAYYEDADLCLKFELLGKRTYYCPAAVVVHIENGTASGSALRLDNAVAVNREKFIARWGRYLGAGHGRGETDVALPPSARPSHADPARVAVLYTPYPLVPGGGERYLLSIAELLSQEYVTYVVTPERYSTLRLRSIAADLDLDLGEVRLDRLSSLADYADCDVFIALGNQALPPVRAVGKRRLYICQFPFPIHPNHLAEVWGALDGYQDVLVYSDFVARHFRERAGALATMVPPVSVLPPPCPMYRESPERRRTGSILNVGRFAPGGHCKRQDALVAAFRDLVARTGRDDLELHLAGTVPPDRDARDYLLDLKARAQGLPVYFHLNATNAAMRELYETASFYWHATGFGTVDTVSPELQEHFGISVVEAMSAGVVPLIFASAGPAEIVRPGLEGRQWTTLEELVRAQIDLLRRPELSSMRAQAKHAARRYDSFAFRSAFDDILARRRLSAAGAVAITAR